MKKKELIRRVALYAGLSKKKSAIIIQSLFETIEDSLEKGENVTFRNFGVFKQEKKNERRFYSISTREIEVLPEHTIVKFVPSKRLKKTTNNVLHKNKEPQVVVCSSSNRKDRVLSKGIHSSYEGRGLNVPVSKKNIGRRRTENTSELHDNQFEYIGSVNYNFYFGEKDHTTFPAIKTPAKDTPILKWYKSHKNAVVGVSEPLLLAEVQKLCEKHKGLYLLDKIALPIKNREYSYRPDIALYWEKYNICIDIEIDETYDICSHKPLHYIGCSDDNLRDTYFTRNGWCVIRYSENQVLHHLSEVIRHLESIIIWLTGGDITNYNLFEETRWTYEDAEKKAKLGFREKELEIESKPDSPCISGIDIESSNTIFRKPDKDILPKEKEYPHDLIIESQLNYALNSNARYLRITEKNGCQWILEKENIQKGIDDGNMYISGNNPITPVRSSYKYEFRTIEQLQPISSLFTDEYWSLNGHIPATSILVKAATSGSPIWIKYKNSQGEKSERFICNMCLFLNSIAAQTPFTDLGTIANHSRNWRTYIWGLCSIRNEFRQFACDDRLLEVKIVNCHNNFLFPKVYESSLAELVMNPKSYRLYFFESVDYLLGIMPDNERMSLLTQGNIANYEVIKGNINKAVELYQSIPYDEIMGESEDKTYLWGNVCMEDIDSFINDFKKEEDNGSNYDIVPSKIVKNFTEVKSMLIQAGWEWQETGSETK